VESLEIALNALREEVDGNMAKVVQLVEEVHAQSTADRKKICVVMDSNAMLSLRLEELQLARIVQERSQDALGLGSNTSLPTLPATSPRASRNLQQVEPELEPERAPEKMSDNSEVTRPLGWEDVLQQVQNSSNQSQLLASASPSPIKPPVVKLQAARMESCPTPMPDNTYRLPQAKASLTSKVCAMYAMPQATDQRVSLMSRPSPAHQMYPSRDRSVEVRGPSHSVERRMQERQVASPERTADMQRQIRLAGAASPYLPSGGNGAVQSYNPPERSVTNSDKPGTVPQGVNTPRRSTLPPGYTLPTTTHMPGSLSTPMGGSFTTPIPQWSSNVNQVNRSSLGGPTRLAPAGPARVANTPNGSLAAPSGLPPPSVQATIPGRSVSAQYAATPRGASLNLQAAVNATVSPQPYSAR
jgi:hypothetical protein